MSALGPITLNSGRLLTRSALRIWAKSGHPRRLTRSTTLKNWLCRIERLRPRGSGTAFQSLFRQAGLAQGVKVPLLSGCPSNRADFSRVA